jgi:DNA polymerase-3 subunit delta'
MLTRLTDIFGQDAAIKSLSDAYRGGRLAHGLVFFGPAGVGKATTAAALAGVFLCKKPQGLEACNSCESCRAMSAGVHPDYHVITRELVRLHDKTGKSKATQISVEVIRKELLEKASLKTSIGQGKVFLIEEAELTTTAAQNAMLKTLEEPSGRALIILLTTRIEDLLPTIRSRCQIIRFAPLDRGRVGAELTKRGIPQDTAEAAAELAAGSLGDALKWIEDGTLAAAREIAGAVDGILSGGTPYSLTDTLRRASDGYAERVLARDELASKDNAVRSGLAIFMGIAARRFRDQMVQNSENETLEQSCRAIEALAQAEKYLDANVNISLTLEQLAVASC